MTLRFDDERERSGVNALRHSIGLRPLDPDPLWTQEWTAEPLAPLLLPRRDYTAALAFLAFAAGLLLGVVLGRRL